jgi:Gpi18-like mannosyltransferase
LNRLLVWIIVAALVIRVAVIGSTGFYPDQQAFEQWALTLATHGPLAIYAAQMQPRVDYPPGYLYALWGAGLAHLATGGGELGFRIAIKTVPILADLVLIVLVYRVCRRMASEPAALWVTGAVAILPPLWIDSAIYGQSDSVPIVFALAAVMAILEGGAGLGLPLLAASLLIKPQALLIVPSIAVVFARLTQRWLQLALGGVGGLALVYVATLPFTAARSPVGVFEFLLSPYLYGAGKAPNATDGAFNLYGIITPFFTSDMRHIGPLTYHAFGVVLVVSFVLAGAVLLFWSLRDVKIQSRAYARLFGNANLSLLALFLFATRMHERYLLPALVFGAPLALDDVPSALAMLWLAFTFSVNCTFIMVGFYGGNHHPITVKLAQAASIGNIVAFVVLWQRQWRRLFPSKRTN